MRLLPSLKITLLFFIVTTGNYVFAQNRVNELDHYFSALSANGRFNGNVLVAEKGKVIYERSFGYADLSTKRPHTALSSFPIASITKTVTATAILQLQEKGKLQVTDAVIKYLPDFPYPNVTIKHLLSHTSGLPDYDELFLALLTNHPDTVFTNKDLIPAAIAGKLPLAFQPGAAFEYNNVNFNVLALIVEKISGLSFGAYLHQYIFQPAGLTNTSLSEFFTRKDKHLSTLYRNRCFWSESLEKADTVIEFHRGLHNYNFMGHGDIISTARDLLKYDEALYNSRLLNEATLTAAFTPVKLANGNDNPQRYALGWVSVGDTLAGQVVMHTGGIPGVRSILFRNISRHQTVILLDNTSNNLYTYADNGLKILNGIKVASPGKSAAKQYSIALANKGITAGAAALVQMEKDTVNYDVDEEELNILGYEFMANKMDTAALEVFKTNVRLFPASWNVYDSYGEVLLKTGKKEEAIRMYKKSVELNGGNENGKKVLEQLTRAGGQVSQPAPYVPESRELYDAIVKMDSIFFGAYNTCDMEKMTAIFSDSLEFYHDKAGLSTSKKEVLDAIRKNICGKVIRELVQGSIEVYPIHNYGAVEIGFHRFHNKVEGSVSRPGKFITIWQKKGDSWLMTRIISLH